MAEIRNEATLLVNTVIAVGLTLLISPLSFSLLTTIGGIIILLILYTYGQDTRRTAGQTLAFAAVAALPLTVAAGMGIQQLAERKDLETWLAVTWLCATVLGTAIDRARISARTAQTATAPGASVSAAHVSVPPAAERTGQPLSHPTPASARTASASKYSLGLSGAATPEQPIEATPKPEVPGPQSTPVEPMPVTPEPERTAASAPQPVAPPPPQARPVEETTIYINIIDQGISLLRSVRAEHIARDIYRIVEPKPEREIWRYEPGQTVRCRKQKLSFGKALVAFEEIILQRAN
jgi:hypothetical protein